VDEEAERMIATLREAGTMVEKLQVDVTLSQS